MPNTVSSAASDYYKFTTTNKLSGTVKMSTIKVAVQLHFTGIIHLSQVRALSLTECHHQRVWPIEATDSVVDGVMSGHCFTDDVGFDC